MSRPRIGIALGGGAARGWAHLGILRWLQEHDLYPDVVCGTSIGALVGAAAAADELERLENWVRMLKWQDVMSYLDLTFSGGFIRGDKLFKYFESILPDRNIEDLARPFAAVATELLNGQEVWLRKASVYQAVRASTALPGLFAPVRYQDRWLVDGGLVNPVPVSVCRALGAERIIAVDLNADILLRRAYDLSPPQAKAAACENNGFGRFDRAWQLVQDIPWLAAMGEGIKARTGLWTNDGGRTAAALPSLVDVIAQSVYIMQTRITRARMAGDPPDVTLTPRLGHLRLMDFHRAEEAIREGYNCAAGAADRFEQYLR